MWRSRYRNTWDEYITETIEKVKKRWLKSDKVKLKQLQIEFEKSEKECEEAHQKYMKLLNKNLKISNQIDKLNNKYTYKQTKKVLNPHYSKEYTI